MNATRIEWTERTWNPITGCPGPKISPGCDHCYAERMAKRLAGRCGYNRERPFDITVHETRMNEPLHLKKPSRIFVCSMGDLFHDDVPDMDVAQVFLVMTRCPQHTFFVLTKRPALMHQWIKGIRADKSWPSMDNIWFGITICNQEEAEEKLTSHEFFPDIHYFLSLEPLLEPVTLAPRHGFGGCMGGAIGWVVCGGETGQGARPMQPYWARSLRDQCLEEEVPFFFKGNGGKRRAGRLLDGRVWNEIPV